MKRKICFVICILMSIVLVISACKSPKEQEPASGGDNSGGQTDPAAASRKSTVYTPDYLELNDRYTLILYANAQNGYTRMDGVLYFQGYEVLNSDPYESRPVLVSYAPDSGELAAVALDSPPEGEELEMYVPTTDGGHISANRELKNSDTRREVTKYAADGTAEFSVSVDGLIYAVEHRAYDGSADNGGSKFYIASDERVTVLSASGERLAEISDPSKNVYSILYRPDDGGKNPGYGGKMVVIFANASGNAMSGYIYSNYAAYEVSLDIDELGAEIALPDDLLLYGGSFHIGPDYDLYARTSAGLFGVNSGEEAVLLAELLNSGVDSSYIDIAAVISSDKIICITTDRGISGGKTDIITLTMPKDGETAAEKQVITLAHFGADSYLSSYVLEFNRNSAEYRIETIDYSIYREIGSIEDRMFSIFSNEVMAGDIPDIVQWYKSNNVEGMNEFIKKGLFTDLYPLFDGDLSRDEYMSCLQEPLEYDGKLPLIVPEFYLSVNTAKRENLPAHVAESSMWTHEDFILMYNSLAEGQYIYDWSPLNLIDYAHFVDTENAKVDFDNDTFKGILEVYKGFSNPQGINNRADKTAALRSNEIIISKFDIKGMYDTLYVDFVFGTNDLVFLSKPDSGKSSFIGFQAAYGITEKSTQKEGAWEFLKLITESEIRMRNNRNGTIPPRVSDFEAMLENSRGLSLTSTSNGNVISYDYFTEEEKADSPESEFISVTQAHIDMIYKLLENPGYTYELYLMISTIVYDEALPFRNGDITTADQAAKAIQSRAGVYISETFG